MADTNTPRIEAQKLEKLVQEILCAQGVDSQESSIIAQVFVWFDLIERKTQGVSRLSVYLKKFQHGLIQSPCHPEFIQKSETIHLINGHNGFGHYLGHIAMSKAVDIAKKYGVGLVGVSHSNHFGAGAYYVQLAAQNDQIGFAFSNSVPHVAPYGGITATLGTNPFAFAAPTQNGQSILVDFSTGASAGSTIMKAIEGNKTIPEGILIDESGKPIVNPEKAHGAVMLPFGGAKGFCLGLMIEILSGVITGAGISHEVASLHRDLDKNSNVGHFFVAIDIAKIMSLNKYYDRINHLTNFIKAAKKQEGIEEILMPGETRWRAYIEQLKKGILLDKKAILFLKEQVKKLNLSDSFGFIS